MRISSTALWTVIAALALCAAPPASAAAASKQENIGVSTGAIIGVVAGGPIGLIVGAALGAKVGDTMHNKSERIDELQGTLAGSRETVAELETDLNQLSGQVTQLQQTAHPELVSLMQAGIEMDLLFRTDEAALTDTTGDRLAQLAGTLAQMPEVYVQLDGYADERGAAEYNYTLSEKRTEFVRDLFVAAGVSPKRITASAHGESVAQDENIDSLALERRVGVKLFIDGAQPLASNPNPD